LYGQGEKSYFATLTVPTRETKKEFKSRTFEKLLIITDLAGSKNPTSA
jgi:hypothetical protein